MKRALEIFAFLLAAERRGERTVLVTLTDVTGGSSREAGTHIAVAERGAWLGSLSGGCIEATVVSEALDVLDKGMARQVRFGAGSPYIDIRLPCGGAIDLLFSPDPARDVIEAAAAALVGRRPIGLRLGKDGALELTEHRESRWNADGFVAAHEPDVRLVIAGHGEEMLSLARTAIAASFATHAITPDDALREKLLSIGAQTSRMVGVNSGVEIEADPFTAIVLLFHEHEWEDPVLRSALATPAFFIGAMGSRATHQRRVATLEANGVHSVDIARVIGPVGIIPMARDPDTLAISILAQIVNVTRTRGSLGESGA